jgi:3-hydroxybutyryl-CoA dehydrogenase
VRGAVKGSGEEVRMSSELDEKADAICTVGVAGAGQMGGGIAQVAAACGLDVRMADASLDLARAGKDKIEKALGKQVDKGKMTADAASLLLVRITPVATLADFAPCDLVVEAATENVNLKLELFQACDRALRPGAWLASNTSSISITKLAAATSRAERVIGMHFMNPPPLMKLVEIVRGLQTSNETYEVVSRVARKMGKTVITSKDAPGFLVNRMLMPLLSEACFALQEGLGTAEDIDTGAKVGLNHPMGPLELADLVGLDTMLSIMEVLHREFGDDKYRAPTLLRNLVAAGRHGRKTGRGFYAYDGKGNKTGKEFDS